MEIQKRYLGIDYGISKYGIAISSDLVSAYPLYCLRAKQGIVRQYQIDKIIFEYGITHIVVGWPENVDRTPPKLGIFILSFIAFLQARHPLCRIDTQNELYTSREAKRYLSSKKDILLLDAFAACLILQDYGASLREN